MMTEDLPVLRFDKTGHLEAWPDLNISDRVRVEADGRFWICRVTKLGPYEGADWEQTGYTQQAELTWEADDMLRTLDAKVEA